MTVTGGSIHYRATATIVGALFLAGMVIGIPGSILIQSILTGPDYLSGISANSMKIAIGAILWMFCVAGDAAHGVLMYPVLKRQNEFIALGYFSFRIVDAVFIGIHVLFILMQIPLGSEFLKAGAAEGASLKIFSTILLKANLYAYNIGMITLGIAGSMLCYSFYKSTLVPRFVAVWGIVGYVTILIGSVLEVMGFDLMLIHTIPGGLWELFIGVWLIVKGFNPMPADAESVR